MTNIAIDVMGGDRGLENNLSGLDEFAKNHTLSGLHFRLYGDEAEISRIKGKFPSLSALSLEVIDTKDQVIDSDEKPVHALRSGKGSSMYEAIASVANGESDVAVSSGNTGAYLALSTVLIGTIDGIIRPALVSMIPNRTSKTVMLDLGANVDCSAEKLLQFSLMGSAVAQTLLGIDQPRVGLLNIGTERMKGSEVLSVAYDLCSKVPDLNFLGFVEGTDMTSGQVDVIVTDGFSGNIALKALEGTIKFVAHLIKEELSSSLLSKAKFALLGKSFIRPFKSRINTSNYNGAPFVGLKRIVIKSHGSADAQGFAHAIQTGVSLAESNFVENIKLAMERAVNV